METTTTSSYQTTPQTQPNVWAIGAKGGLYTGLVLILISLIVFLAGWYGNKYGSTISSVISYIIGIFLTHKAFKDQGNGYLTYAQGLGLGTILGGVSGILSSAFMVIYLTVIDPALMQTQMETARIQLEEDGMSDAQIDQALEISEMFMSPVSMFLMGIVGGIIFGFIVALIVSIFTKNTDPTVEY